ncbi:UNVERIFIED_ORG: hypothetical protein GGD58_002937 [Rhizobium pisi]
MAAPAKVPARADRTKLVIAETQKARPISGLAFLRSSA